MVDDNAINKPSASSRSPKKAWSNTLYDFARRKAKARSFVQFCGKGNHQGPYPGKSTRAWDIPPTQHQRMEGATIRDPLAFANKKVGVWSAPDDENGVDALRGGGGGDGAYEGRKRTLSFIGSPKGAHQTATEAILTRWARLATGIQEPGKYNRIDLQLFVNCDRRSPDWDAADMVQSRRGRRYAARCK